MDLTKIRLSFAEYSKSATIMDSWIYDQVTKGKNVYHNKRLSLHGDEDKEFNFVNDESFDNLQKIQSHYLSIVLFNEDVLIFVERVINNEYIVVIIGNFDQVKKFESVFYSLYKKVETDESVEINWAFLNRKGDFTKKRQFIKKTNLPFTEMYPFIKEGTLQDLYDDYYNDSANILILKGPAGTGKTSFIKGMLFHLKQAAYLTYDEMLAKSDELFEDFFDNTSEFLIFEDADAFLMSRTDGNKMMHRFLNMGDGLISRPNKKIIFTTNLENLSDIDPALTRPGRCYDIIEFEPLNLEQAKRVAEISGKQLNLPENKVTIAEIFNSQKYRKEKKKSSIGFI